MGSGKGRGGEDEGLLSTRGDLSPLHEFSQRSYRFIIHTPVLQVRIWRPRGAEELLTDTRPRRQPVPDLCLVFSSMVWVPSYWDMILGPLKRHAAERVHIPTLAVYDLLGDIGK